MDERQAQIRERAGLEESRLNQEFIEWLQKWGTWILVGIAVVAGGYALRDRFQRSQNTKLDEGFAELESATSGGNASPDTLLTIAGDYQGKASIEPMARLEAADAYLDAVCRGVKPGAAFDAKDGTLIKPEDALTDADRADFLNKAAEQYQLAYDESANNAGRKVLAIGALYGLAAVAESKLDLTKAKGYYDQIVTLAEANKFPGQAAVAKQRIAKLGDLSNVPKVYSKTELPPPPKREEPPAPAPAAPVPAPAAPAPGAEAPAPSPSAPATPSNPAPTNPAPTPVPTPAPAPTPSPENPATPPK
jgi:hypothetical protein